MKAERKAELRNAEYRLMEVIDPDEILNEVDRLEGLVRAAHQFDGARTRVVWVWSPQEAKDIPLIRVRCCGCTQWADNISCKDPMGSPRTDEAKAAHAAHVQALIDGDA